MPAVNIWALDKDQSIKFLLLSLAQAFAGDSFVIDTSSPVDRSAVYIHHPEMPEFKAYLYSHGQDFERYGVHLEYPMAMASTNLIDAHENLSLRALVQILAVHLDIADVTTSVRS